MNNCDTVTPKPIRLPVLELDQNKKITTSYLYGADGVVYRRKHNAVAHWHFDEGNGTTAHDVDGANHGTLGGGEAAKIPTWSFGCGLLFDGVNDLVKVPDSDALDLAGDKITIAAWVQPHSDKVAPLVEKINRTHGYRISQIGNKLRFVIHQNGQDKTVTSTTTLPPHKWTHVAARYNGAQIRIFINGTIDTATTATTGALAATTAPLFIDGEHNHFHGYLDDVSIYDRALSDREITDLVNGVDKRYEYHHLNALGSNIVLTDDNQTVLVRYEYDVFGAIRNETGTSDNTRKFTGKEFDADSNLYYYGARYYDPYIGRFTQRDPIADGVNWYAYTANNPLRFVDPTGLAQRSPNETEYQIIRDAAIFTFGEVNAERILDFVTIKFTDNPDDVGGSGLYIHSTKTILLDASWPGLDNPNLVSLDGLTLPRPLTSAIHEMVHALDHLANLGGSDLGVKDGWDAGKNYDHTIEQLRTLTLPEEPFAKAVQQWFTVQYSSKYGLYPPGNTINMAEIFSWASGGRISGADALEWANSGIYDNALQLIRRPFPALPLGEPKVPIGEPKLFGGI